MTPKIPIVPAIIPSSAEAVRTFLSDIPFVHEVHLDVVDGVFVPAISWPLEPVDSPLTVKSYTDRYTLEVDLMMKEPWKAAEAWEAAGADMLVFHVETIDVPSLKDFTQSTTASVGIAFHGETPIEALDAYVPYVDYIQVMGIEVIGAQGQSFSVKTIEKITALKNRYPVLPVSVDGSINRETISAVVRAGADRVIVGSAIYQAEDRAVAYKTLVEIVNE